MSAKQNRPIGQYMEQFEDVTPEPMFEQDEFDKRIAKDQAAYKAQKGINTDTDPEEKTSIVTGKHLQIAPYTDQ